MDWMPHQRATRDWLIVAALSLFFALAFHSGTWESWDEDRYYTAAQALHRGWGFVHAEHPHHAPETLTPPGYPAFLALAMAVTGEDPQALKWTGAGLLALVLAVWFALARRWWPGQPIRAWSTWLLGFCCVPLLAYSGLLMADLATLLLSLLALLAYPERDPEPDARRVFVAGLLLGLAYLCRAATLSLMAALALHLLVRRAWRPAVAYGLGLCLFALPWWFRNTVLLDVPDQYVAIALQGGIAEGAAGPLQTVWNEVRRDLPAFVRQFPSLHFYQLFDGDFLLARLGLAALAVPTQGLFLLLVAAGWLHRLRRPGPLEFFLPLHLLLISAYPRPFHDTNYLFPLLPLTAFYFVHALQVAGAALDRRPAGGRTSRYAQALTAAAAASALALTLAGGAAHARKAWRVRGHGPWDTARYGGLESENRDWIRFVEAGGWIRTNTPPDTLVASRKPKHMFVFSDRRGWRFDAPGDVGYTNVWDALIGLTNVVIVEDCFAARGDSFNSYGNARVAILRPLMDAHHERLELLHESAAPTTRVWRVRPRPAG